MDEVLSALLFGAAVFVIGVLGLVAYCGWLEARIRAEELRALSPDGKLHGLPALRPGPPDA